jgi:uncharacterized repeat protein (TIGR03803 family)
MSFIRLGVILVTVGCSCLLVARAGSPIFTSLYSFAGGSDSSNPVVPLAIGSDGVLYGAAGGGSFGYGSIFSLSPPTTPGGAWTEKVIWSFSGASDYPAGIIIGEDGVLYGTSCNGGSHGYGSVFSLTPPSVPGGAWTDSTLWNFAGGNDGIQPCAGVAMGPGGVLYGPTIQGGNPRLGIVFSLTPPVSPGEPWTEAVLHTFTGGSDAKFPTTGGIVVSQGGVLYGTSPGGGDFAQGTVYSLMPPESSGEPWVESIIYSFKDGNDGANPSGNLFSGTDGVLYGATSEGGPGNGGTLFSLSPPTSTDSSWRETILYRFRPHAGVFNHGAHPQGNLLVLKGTGNVFGATEEGGPPPGNGDAGFGTSFALRPPAVTGRGWALAEVHEFNGTDGYIPSGMAKDRNGVLYGVTALGGTQNKGTVFSLKP